MRLGVLAFLIGILGCQTLKTLPEIPWLALLCFLVVLAGFPSRLRGLLLCGIGFLWIGWRAYLVLMPTLPPALEGKDVVITGTLIGLPERLSKAEETYGWRFHFAPDQLSYHDHVYPSPGHLRLSWYDPDIELRPHQRWQLTVRLKRPHSLLNPGSFDYAGWLFQNKIRAVGYVRPHGQQQLLQVSSPFSTLEGVRYQLGEAIRHALREQPMTGLLIALAIGDRQDISATQNTVLRATGTLHLLAISGLHIGLVALFAFSLVHGLGRYWGETIWLWYPRPYVAASCALLAALGYALLAGFSIPTQRAFMMVGIAMLAVLSSKQLGISSILALTLGGVLLWDPFAVMNAGFWLSFGAVAAILYGVSGQQLKNNSSPLVRWGYGFWQTQWAVTLGLLPILLASFGYVSLVSLPANAIAIPWVSFAVIPLTLLGTLVILPFPALGSALLQLAAYLLNALWTSISALAQLDGALWQPSTPPEWALLTALLGIGIILLPRGFPGRWLGVIGLLPLFFARFPAPEINTVWFTLLEVGQGLAAVIRTQQHTLVYDAGPRLSADFDMGEAVVLPFLRVQNISHIDTLMISHGDNDHSGGAITLLQHSSVGRLLTSVPQQFKGYQAERCQAGQSWQWDGITFTVLHPPVPYTAKRENNRSCVLKVQVPQGPAVLLPGDIEKAAERFLLHRHREQLAADMLIVPHHGSRTSSTDAFITAVNPKIALFSVGYLNRFGFPKTEVVQRYRQRGVVMWQTDQTGAIQFKLSQQGIATPTLARETLRRYWHVCALTPCEAARPRGPWK